MGLRMGHTSTEKETWTGHSAGTCKFESAADLQSNMGLKSEFKSIPLRVLGSKSAVLKGLRLPSCSPLQFTLSK